MNTRKLLGGSKALFSLFTSICFHCATLALGVMLLGQSLRAATLTTDKDDYSPGQTVIITGSGFAPGETVSVVIKHVDGTTNPPISHGPWTAVANSSGGLSTTWVVCSTDCVGALLDVVATGTTSFVTASARFTDGSTGLLQLP